MSISDLKKKIGPILRRNNVKKAAIFGSTARGDARKNSDIDILIEFKNNDKSLFDLAGLQIELEEKLKKTVDLLTYNSLNPLFKKNILKDPIRL